MASGRGEVDFKDDDELLQELKRCGLEMGDDALARSVDALEERVAEGRFYVACVGQFKRGKSTLLNALVGQRLLPEGIVPVTSVLTVLRHGAALDARVRLRGQPWESIPVHRLREFVSEAENPENARRVDLVEVFVPSELLRRGMCLVDTPGIGSCLAGNSAETWAFVPQIDAALIVLGADPPITAEELKLTSDIASHVRDFVFVVNKADKLSDDELREGAAFAKVTLEKRLGRKGLKLLEISALDRVHGREPRRDWDRLVESLDALDRSTGRRLVRDAAMRGRRRIAAALLREIDESRQALIAPVAESEERVRTLHLTLTNAEQSLRDLSHLLRAEQERLYALLTQRQESFVDRAREAARAELEHGLNETSDGRLGLRRRAFDLALDIARTWLNYWLDEEVPEAEQSYREATMRFVELGNDFLQRLVGAEHPGATSIQRLDPESGFRTRSRLHFTELMTLEPGPISWLQDVFRTRRGLLEAVTRDACAYMDSLLETNASRIVGDLNERVLESRRQLEMDIRNALRSAIASAERALERARAAQASGAEGLKREDTRLRELRQRVLQLDRCSEAT